MLSEVAEQILKTKYYKKDETFDQLCLRVAYVVAGAEKTDEERNHWASKYYQLMNELWFLPAGRILANANNGTKNLYNCYTHSIEDSRESIYRTLANTAEIFAHGGGVGINFSKLRERGAPVSNGSTASGPISFMYVFDQSAEVISQASRRGAMLGLLEVDHLDIEEFIKAKDEEGILTHFNLSVGLTDEFMQAVEDRDDFYLKSRYSEFEMPVDAETLFDSIARHAWKSGDPGFIYIDRLEEANATPHTGRLEVTNPCFTGDMRLLTTEGFLTFKELCSRKNVKALDNEGNSCAAIILATGKKPIIELLLGSGRTIKCTEDHILLTTDGPMKAIDTYNYVLINYTHDRTAPLYNRDTNVNNIKHVGNEEVYDFMLNSDIHWGVVEGIIVHNCGETPLRDEACCLASINLTKMLTKVDGEYIIDQEKLVYTVSLVTRFLDSVHDASQAPIPEIDEKIMGARRIGLGIFGWADTLAMMGIPYESETALNIARVVSAIMKQAAYDTSVWLAEEKGAYPVFDPEKSRNIWYPSDPVLPTRNAMLLSLAPTGSISLLANTNGGIEPFFALAYRKNVTAGSGETKYQITNINQYLLAYLDRLVGADTKERVLNHLALTGEIQSLNYLPIKLRELFKTAHDISPEFRVKIQAAWQKNVDGAISSTVNLPNSATVEDIKEIIMLGWKLGLKGLTVFRDKCRSAQILEVGTKSNCNCETCGI